MKLKQALEVPIESVNPSKWDIRRRPEDPEEFAALKKSIQEDGLFFPLLVARTEQGDLVIMAGRRRLKALKELGWKTVPVFVQIEKVSETQLRKITLKENVIRRGLIDSERGYGILAVFEGEGYTASQTISGIKSIDNWFSQHTNNKTDWKEFHNSVMKVTRQKPSKTSELRRDEKFCKLCEEMDFSPKYQYQLLQIVLQLDPSVLTEAENHGLNTHKKLLLTHSKIRDHPKIQKALIPKIKNLTEKQAEIIVRQAASDLETGYLTRDGTSYTYSGKGSEARDKVQSNPKKEETGEKKEAYYLKLMEAVDRVTFLLTGRAITKGETTYTKEIVDNNKEHRYKIVKSFDGDIRELNSLHNAMKIAQRAINDILEIIDSELDISDKKREMSRR